MRRLLSNKPRGYSLLFMRRQAEAGLLRDGGMTAAQVNRYIQELRHEAEQEVALRLRQRVSAPVSPKNSKQPIFASGGMAFAHFQPWS